MFYLDLFRALQEAEVRYLVVGGLAVNLYGVERATMDVDLMLAMDADNLDRFVNVARMLKLSPVAPVALESLRDETTRRTWIEEKGNAELRSPSASLSSALRQWTISYA